LFFLAFLGDNLGVKKGQGRGGNRPTDLGHKEVNPWGKSKFASFYPKNFLQLFTVDKKTLSWGIKRTKFRFTPQG